MSTTPSTTSGPARITHLIAGTPWAGTAERTSQVFNPATGEHTGNLDLASADLVGEVVVGRAMGQHLARKAHPGALQVP